MRYRAICDRQMALSSVISAAIDCIAQQQAQLSQRDRATRYVSWNSVSCSTSERKIAF